MIAKSKAHELELIDLDSKYSHDPNLMNSIYLFLKDMRLLKKGEDKKEQVRSFHELLCLDNDKFPDRLPFMEVYPAFLSFILKTDPDVKDTNDVKIIFNQYFAPKLRDPEPKITKASGDSNGNMFKPSIAKADPGYVSGPIEGWPDDTLKDQYILMKNLLREDFEIKQELKGTYTYKLVTEMKERGILQDEVQS